jgi:hypothetical protein
LSGFPGFEPRDNHGTGTGTRIPGIGSLKLKQQRFFGNLCCFNLQYFASFSDFAKFISPSLSPFFNKILSLPVSNLKIVMAVPSFTYQEPFPTGEDTTEYYLLTNDHVSVTRFEGKEVLKVEPEALTKVANAALRDCSFLLRTAHQEQVAAVLSDPEASENDKYVALTMLRNAEVSAKGLLPFCQDTGTATIIGKKGQQVWTGGNDEERRTQNAGELHS